MATFDDHMEKNSFASKVTSPHVKGKINVYLREGYYTQNTKLAIWLGNEALRISALAVERSEMFVAIPVFAMNESLNLGTYSGIVLYEFAKQRLRYQSTYRCRRREGKRVELLHTLMARGGDDTTLDACTQAG